MAGYLKRRIVPKSSSSPHLQAGVGVCVCVLGEGARRRMQGMGRGGCIHAAVGGPTWHAAAAPEGAGAAVHEAQRALLGTRRGGRGGCLRT